MSGQVRSLPRWALEASPDDWLAVGIPAQTRPDALRYLVDELCVDLTNVAACLHLVRAHAVVLHLGLPRVMLAFSVKANTYWASFDGVLDHDLQRLTESGAGFWLAIAATELGALPTTPEAWGVIRITKQGPSGPDKAAIQGYVTHPQPARLDPDYGAFWALYAHAKEGRCEMQLGEPPPAQP